jgi:K+-sensing histidine kinase KdpD
MAVALAWIPLRKEGSSVDVALALMIVITAAGATGRRAAVVGAAVAAAVGFTFFDTAPYDQFVITRASDAVTAVLLVIVGLATGELAVRVARERRADHPDAGDMSRVRKAAASLAAGDELVTMIGSVADELIRLLDLKDCWFAADPIEAEATIVDREGRLQREEQVAPEGRAVPRSAQVVLPVWGQGQVLGHFVLDLSLRFPPRHEQLLVAVTLADQVGAALFAQAPPVTDPPPSNPPAPGLRVVR